MGAAGGREVSGRRRGVCTGGGGWRGKQRQDRMGAGGGGRRRPREEETAAPGTTGGDRRPPPHLVRIEDERLVVASAGGVVPSAAVARDVLHHQEELVAAAVVAVEEARDTGASLARAAAERGQARGEGSPPWTTARDATLLLGGNTTRGGKVVETNNLCRSTLQERRPQATRQLQTHHPRPLYTQTPGPTPSQISTPPL